MLNNIIEIIKEELASQEVYLKQYAGGMRKYIEDLQDSDEFYNEAATLGAIASVKSILKKIYSSEAQDSTTSYLDEKIRYLEDNENVVFEYRQLIYKIFLTSEGEYDVSVYDLEDIIYGDELNVVDGGVCTGSAKDAVWFMLDSN